MADIDPMRRELARRMLARRFSDRSGREIPRQQDGTVVPLTPVQAGIWFASQLFPDSAEYNIFDVMSVARAVGVQEVRAAARTLVERHDVLRLRIELIDDAPRQHTVPPFTPEIDWHDLSSLSPREADASAAAIASRCARVIIGSDTPPLFRITGIAMPGGRTRIVLVLHHVIADFVTEAVLLEELGSLLVGRTLPPPPVGFVDYAHWLHSRSAESPRVDAELAWWTERLSGDLPRLEVPFDHVRPAQPNRAGHAAAFTLPPDTHAGLRRVAAERGGNLFTVFLSVYYVLLARLSGARDLIVGTALLGRDHPEVEKTAGCFVRTVPLRTTVDLAWSFFDLVDAAQSTVIEAQDHQEVTFDRIVEALGVPREIGVHPVFQTYFGFLDSARPRVPGVEVDPAAILDYATSKWDMSLSVWETPDGAQGVFEGSADLFDQSTVDVFKDIYVRLCSAIAEDPRGQLRRHALVVGAERERLAQGLDAFAEAEVPYSTLSAPFEEQAARTPDAVAIETASTTISYGEFDEWSDRLATVLRDRGAQRVALLMDRSAEMLAAIYGVARSGAAYVPLDPDIPAARLALMLEDTDPELVIADAAYCAKVPEGPWASLSFEQLDALTSESEVSPPFKRYVPGGSGRPSHLLYTSGSTGRPKAVVCTVATAVADIRAMQAGVRFGPDDAILFKTSYGFDSSLWEVFWPLYAGARIVVCPPGDERDPARLAEVIERHEVTVVDLTPTVLQAFLEQIRPGRLASLRCMLTGGEMVSPALRDGFRDRSEIPLVNGYGPTETACVAHGPIEHAAGAAMPVGRPHPHVRVRILDEAGEPVPTGVPGEAYICSSTMSLGYHNRPSLTAERFVPDPFGPPGSRAYRTGDICRLRPDGLLEVLGRLDGQVKIRGLRVELGEIESAIGQNPDVGESIALVIGTGADAQIAAFVRPRAGSRLDLAALHEHVVRLLPRHMVPSTLQVLDRIPVTVNGKADRAALRRMWRPEERISASHAVPPASEIEAVLAELFAEVLGLAVVGVTDGFFDIGGHSLLVFRLLAACEKRLGIRLQVADVFAAPTVRRLAERLRLGIRPSTTLVPLDSHPGRPLLIFVHAVSGSAMPFRALAAELGDTFSCHGLQTPEYEPGEEAPSLVELAARHVASVDEIRGPGEPVYVGGWSMGGSVAIEMARLWQQRGVPVDGLFLLDAWLPPRGLTNAEDRRQAEKSLREADFHVQGGVEEVLAAAPSESERLARAVEANAAAYLEYEPTPLSVRAHLLRATEGLAEVLAALPCAYHVEGHGWGRFLDGLAVHDVPGGHYTMLRAEYAKPLAQLIRSIRSSDRADAP